MKPLFLLGRVVYGGFFIQAGINHFLKADEMAQYARAKNIPLAKLGVYVTGAMMVAGGASVVLGIKPKLGAAAVGTFLASASVLMHDFWTSEDPARRQQDLIHFSKNMALLGAALALVEFEEPWPASVPLAGGETETGGAAAEGGADAGGLGARLSA